VSRLRPSHTINIYVYKGRSKLGKEPLGSDGRAIWRDLKTVAGGIRRARRIWGHDFSLFTFTNFFNDDTFTRRY